MEKLNIEGLTLEDVKAKEYEAKVGYGYIDLIKDDKWCYTICLKKEACFHKTGYSEKCLFSDKIIQDVFGYTDEEISLLKKEYLDEEIDFINKVADVIGMKMKLNDTMYFENKNKKNNIACVIDYSSDDYEKRLSEIKEIDVFSKQSIYNLSNLFNNRDCEFYFEKEKDIIDVMIAQQLYYYATTNRELVRNTAFHVRDYIRNILILLNEKYDVTFNISTEEMKTKLEVMMKDINFKINENFH